MKLLRRSAALILALLLLLAAVPAVYAADDTEADSSKLLALMAVAERAKQEDYTAESWGALQNALNIARNALDVGTQARIDAAASVLAKALADIVKMDYSELDDALAELEDFIQSENMPVQWGRLLQLMADRASLETSGDQAAVDAAAAEVRQILAELKQTGEDSGDSTMWIVLFSISAVINGALIALGVVALLRYRKTKKYQNDDMPLVDYDIDDDIV